MSILVGAGLAIWLVGTVGVRAASSPQAFSFGPVPGEVAVGEPFLVEVRALDASGEVATNDTSTVLLRAFVPQPEWPVISEVDVWGQVIEITAVGASPLDLSDWELVVGREATSFGFTAHTRVRMPAGSTLASGMAATVSGTGAAPGVFPALISAQPFDRPGANFTAIRLLDPTGVARDEVHLLPSQYSSVLSLWQDVGLKFIPGTRSNLVHSRIGDANHFRNADWVTNVPPSPRALNPGLGIPWRNRGDWVALRAEPVQLTEGVWSGLVALPSAGDGVMVVADNQAGLLARSAPIRVRPWPQLTLGVPEELRFSSEATAGQVREVKLTLPGPLGQDLEVALACDAPEEFALPARVVVAAGRTETSFLVTNLDDAWGDGEAQATLTASAPGWRSAVATLRNRDDEQGRLWLTLPPVLPEGQGPEAASGQVWLEAPARHDVVVELSAAPPLEVPTWVLIPAGRSSAGFAIGVGDDERAAPLPWRVPITATTAGWPTAEAWQTLQDNEDRGFTVEVPAEVVEGSPERGVIRLRAARTEPLVVQLSHYDEARRARLGWPQDIIIPAGVLEQEFTLRVRENTEPEGEDWIELWVSCEGRTIQTGQSLRVYDDDAPLERIQFTYGVPRAVLSGHPFTCTARLVNPFGSTYRANVTGQIELRAPITVAALAPGFGTIVFTNGLWSGPMIAEGAGLGLQMSLTAAGLEAWSGPFDLLRGREHQIAFADVQWWSAGQRFLVVEPAGTNRAARLTELEPLTGVRGRSLDLPGTPNLLALAENGALAWLTSSSNALLRVELGAWRVTSETPLVPGAPQAFAQALFAVPGQPESIVAVVVTNPAVSSLALRRYLAGQPMPASVTASQHIRMPTHLLPVPGESAFWYLWWDGLSRFNLTEQGVAFDRTLSAYNAKSLDLRGNLLVGGDGRVWSAWTGQPEDPFPVALSEVGCLPNGRDVAVFAELNGLLGYFDVASRERLISHAVPDQWTGGAVPAPTRVFPWGDAGLALLFPAQGFFHALESPLLVADRADLQVTLQAPTRARLPDILGLGTSFEVEATVTNRGPTVAQGVELRWNDGTYEALGTLAPGESLRRIIQRGSGEVELLITRATVRAATIDPAPADNQSEVVTIVDRAEFGVARQLILGLNHLIAAPDGTRLYASLSRLSGAATNGIAVIDPALAVVERIIGTPGPPQRLAVSEDGRWLYAGLGSRVLARWDLTTGSNDLMLELPNEPLTDFAIVPGSPRSVAVAAGGHVVIYDDSQPRPGSFDHPQVERRLGFAGGLLWVAQADRLRAFEVVPAGLELRHVPAFVPPWGTLDFFTDGRRLFFAGALFDTQTLEGRMAGTLSNPAQPDPVYPVLYLPVGNNVQRLNRDTLAVEAEQVWRLAATGLVQDLVRWGDGGLAARCGPQVLLTQTPLVPAPGVADLAVTITPPTVPKPQLPFEWTVVATNRSSLTAPRTQLVIGWGRWPDGLEIDGPAYEQFGNELSFDLGDLAGNQAVVVRLHGTPRASGFETLTARILSAASDPVSGDNFATSTVAVDPPRADLGMVSISAPLRVRIGEEFAVDAVLTNAGPDVLREIFVGYGGVDDQAYVLVGWEGCQTNATGALVVREMSAAANHRLTLRFQARQSGLHPVAVYGHTERVDANPANDFQGTVVFIEPDAGSAALGVRFPQRGQFAWDPRSHRILATFEGHFSGLVVLDPETLAPVSRVLLSGYVGSFTPCRDGQHAWVFSVAGFTRINYQTGQSDLTFAPDPIPSVWAMASPAEDPDLLVLVTGDGLVRAFDRGVPLPQTYGPMNFLPRLFFTSAGRLFASSGQQLRELNLGPQGVTEARNLDAAAGWSGVDYTEAKGRLFAADGRIVDVATGQLIDTQSINLADPEIGMAFAAPSCCGAITLQGHDAANLEPVWRLRLPATPIVLTLGTNGFLTTSGVFFQVTPLHALGPEQTDLGLTAVTAPEALGVGFDLALEVAVTNRSAWAARDARLHIALSPGLELAPGQPGAGTSNTWVQLGSIIEGTNLTFQLRPTAVGSQDIEVEWVSALPERDPVDDLQRLRLTVPDVPLVFVDDAAVWEDAPGNTGQLQARLSRPAPGPFEVPFEITPITAQPEDFRTLTGAISFAPGETQSSAWVVQADVNPEFEETASVRLFPVAAALLIRTNVQFTLRNDDVPLVSMADLAVKEGASGETNAAIRFGLSARAPFPVECWFRTAPGTAQSGIDFLPREGWITFAPGETNRTMAIPVLGDGVFEPGETVLVNLIAVSGGKPAGAFATLTIQNDDPPPAPVLVLGVEATGELRLEFPTLVGATYQVQSRTNLSSGSWRSVGSALNGTGQLGQVPLGQPATPATFYRVRAQ